MRLVFFLASIGIPFLFSCSLLQKSVKIQPVFFDYGAIAKNYFGPDQTKPFPLTVQRGNNLYSSLTKEGRYLFFATDQNGNFDIWFRDLQSSIVVPVTNHPATETKPAISPNGRFLVFESREVDPNGDLFFLEIDPTEWTKELLKGNRILSRDYTNLTNQKGGDGFIDTDPVWSPDGKTLVFVSDRLTPGQPNLVQMNPFSPNAPPKLLTNHGGFQPQFSYDGNQIVYVSYVDSALGEIYKLDLVSLDSKRITENSAIDLSPSLDPKGMHLYFASIPKDTNGNGVLEERDTSLLIQKNLATGKERQLSSGETSVFDTKHSMFNGGSLVFSASYSNAINIYFVSEGGSIPKQNSIDEQFEYAQSFSSKHSLSGFFLALDSVELFFEKDPLFPLFQVSVLEAKYNACVRQKQKENCNTFLDSLLKSQDPSSSDYAKAVGESLRLASQARIARYEEALRIYKTKPVGKDIPPALYHRILKEWEALKGGSKVLEILDKIQKEYPDYYAIGEIRRKLGESQFGFGLASLPRVYQNFFNSWEQSRAAFVRAEISEIPLEVKKDLRFAWEKVRTQWENLPTLEQRKQVVDKELQNPEHPNVYKLFLKVLQARALSEEKNQKSSSEILDSIIPIPMGIDLEPPGKPSVFEDKNFQALYSNPIYLEANLLKYQNEKSRGNTNEALRNLKIYLEFYDPVLGVNLNAEDLQNAFFYFENKALEFERQKDLLQSSFHYFFNNQTMFLVKTRNLYLDSIYKEYAVYYQRKMVDTIFAYGKRLREEEEKAILSQINILSKDKLNVVGNLSELTSIVTDNKLLRSIADIRDLEKIEVLSEGALKWTELYYKQAVPRARPYLDLATLYGYAYYLINKNVIYESYYYATNTMTEVRKEEILANYKKAEWELRWIIFADPNYHDAYQLLGWLYQYVDLMKQRKTEDSQVLDEEKYADLYLRYFPSRHLEENVELYNQILVFLGEEKTEPKIVSDLNLNLANNYFLLSDFPKATDNYKKVENASQYLLKKDQFESYKQEAIFRYNYGRSLIYQGQYKKASEQFHRAIQIYFEEEYYDKINQSALLPLQESDLVLREIRSKLALLYALKGLSELEAGVDAIPSFETAIAYNKSVSFIHPINLYNFLAMALQRQGRFIESHEALDQAEQIYKERERPSWFQGKGFSFWNLVFPDKLRVIGEGRFPGEFPEAFKNVMTQGIRIENHIEQREYQKARVALLKRNDFLKSNDLDKTVMGSSILIKSDQILAQIDYENKKFKDSKSQYKKLYAAVVNSEGKARRIAFQGYTNSLFSELDQEGVSKLDLEPDLDFVIQEAQEKQFSPLVLSIAYFWKARVAEEKGQLLESANFYGLANHFFENGDILAPNNFYSPKDKVRSFLNQTNLYLQLGMQEAFLENYKKTYDLAYEFQLQEELFHLYLLKLNFLLSKSADPIGSKKQIEETFGSLWKLWKNEPFLRLYSKRTRLNEFYEIASEVFRFKKDYESLVRLWEEKRRVELFRDAMQAQFEFGDAKLQFAYSDLGNAYRNIKRLYTTIEEKNLRRENTSSLVKRQEKEISVLREKSSLLRNSFSEKRLFFDPLGEGDYASLEVPLLVVQDNGTRYELYQKSKPTWNHFLCPKPLQKETCALPSLPQELYLMAVGKNFDRAAGLDWKAFFEKQSKVVQFIFDRTHTIPFSEKSNRNYKWITILGKSSPEGKSVFQRFLPKTDLSSYLLDTDVLVSETKFPTLTNTFSDPSEQNFPLREIFTSKRNEVSLAIGSQSWFSDSNSWTLTGAMYDALRAGRIPNLVLVPETKTVWEKSQEDFSLIALYSKSDFIAFGSFSPSSNNPNPMEKEKDNSKNAKALLEEAKEAEKVRDFSLAYAKYYSASSLMLGDSDEFWDTKTRMAHLKSILFPEIPLREIYIPLWESAPKEEWKNKILYSFSVNCLMKKESSDCATGKEKFIGETGSLFAEALSFYTNLKSGEIDTAFASESARKKIEAKEDAFSQRIRLGGLYIQLLLLDEAQKETDAALLLAKTPREKNVIKNRNLEILFHKAFLLGDGGAERTNLSSTATYSLGFRKDWKEFDQKINSREFTKFGYADSIYDQYRVRIYENWKKLEIQGYFDPLTLTPEFLTSGKSVLSKLSSLNRSLLFFILYRSVPYQKESEVSSLIELLAKQEETDGFAYRAIAMRMVLMKRLALLGEVELLQKYQEQFSRLPKKIWQKHSLLSPLWIDTESAFQISKATDRFLFSDKAFDTLLKKAYSEEPKNFLKNLNQYGKLFSGKDLSLEEKEKWEQVFFVYLNQALAKNQSEVFFDLACAREDFRFYSSRFLGKTVSQKSFPVFRDLAEAFKAKIPVGQEFSMLVELGNKTIHLSFSQGKSTGRDLFADHRTFKRDLFRYLSQMERGGILPIARESLSDRLRNQLRLAKGKRHYLYLTGFYSLSPLQFPKDLEVYFVGSATAFLDHSPVSMKDLNAKESGISWEADENALTDSNKVILDLIRKETKAGKEPKTNHMVFQPVSYQDSGFIGLGKEPIGVLNPSLRKQVTVFGNEKLGEISAYVTDYNGLSYYLARSRHGIYVLHSGNQTGLHNVAFLREFFSKTDRTPLQRWEEGRLASRNASIEDRNWVGYRLFTSQLLLEGNLPE